MPKHELPAEPERTQMTDQDFLSIAEFVVDTHKDRKTRRADEEKKWKEVDRQIRMEPERRLTADGKPLGASGWMSELEPPWQAETLEADVADARRLIFPDDRRFFSVHAMLEDDVINAIESDQVIPGIADSQQNILDITGTDRGRVDQTVMNELVFGGMTYIHSLYDMRQAWDLVNAEAFKYGVGIGRARRIFHDKHHNDYRGVFRERTRFPVFAAKTVWNTYLDDRAEQIIHEGFQVGASILEAWETNLDALKMAANKGSKSPTTETGGWMPDAIHQVEPTRKRDNNVWTYEFEGDLIVPRNGSRSLFLPNVIVNVLVSKQGPKVYRYREREFDFNSYIPVHYHRPDVRSAYGDSPLMMGVPLQKAAADAFNSMQDVAKIQADPPATYNPSDHYLTSTGGPQIEPGKNIETVAGIDILKIGDLAAMVQVFQILRGEYKETTSTTAPRLGQPTKSHQTRFAVSSEQTRGLVRPVDYVQTTLWGPMTNWLNMEYDMMKLTFKGGLEIYIPGYRTWLKLSDKHFPSKCYFEAHGVAGPVDKREREIKRQQAIAFVLKIEEIRLSRGGKPMDYEQLERMLLEDGEFDNIDELFEPAATGDAGGVQGRPGLSVIDGGASNDQSAAIINTALRPT